MADPNAPGLRVCFEDRDQLDPWRLPPRSPDRITLDHPRPDDPLYPFGSTPIYPKPVQGVAQVNPTAPWVPDTFYTVGSSVTPLNANSPANPELQYEYVATRAGVSGGTAPQWPNHTGTSVTDGAVTWFCLGIFLLDGQTELPQIYPNAPSVVPPPPAIVVPPPPLPFAGNLINDSGMVGIEDEAGWAIYPGAPGTFYLNSGAIMIVPGGTPTSSAPVYFNGLLGAALQKMNAANFPLSPGQAGSGTLWNNGGFLWVS